MALRLTAMGPYSLNALKVAGDDVVEHDNGVIIRLPVLIRPRIASRSVVNRHHLERCVYIVRRRVEGSGVEISTGQTVRRVARANRKTNGRKLIRRIRKTSTIRLRDELRVRIVDDVTIDIVARGDIAARPIVRPDSAFLRNREISATDEDTRDTKSTRGSAGRSSTSDCAVSLPDYGIAVVNGTRVILKLNFDLLIGRSGTVAAPLTKSVRRIGVRHNGTSFAGRPIMPHRGQSRTMDDLPLHAGGGGNYL